MDSFQNAEHLRKPKSFYGNRKIKIFLKSMKIKHTELSETSSIFSIVLHMNFYVYSTYCAIKLNLMEKVRYEKPLFSHKPFGIFMKYGLLCIYFYLKHPIIEHCTISFSFLFL